VARFVLRELMAPLLESSNGGRFLPFSLQQAAGIPIASGRAQPHHFTGRPAVTPSTETLRLQLIRDLARLHHLILRVAAGDRSLKPERDDLERLVMMTLHLWKCSR